MKNLLPSRILKKCLEHEPWNLPKTWTNNFSEHFCFTKQLCVKGDSEASAVVIFHCFFEDIQIQVLKDLKSCSLKLHELWYFLSNKE